MEIKDVKLASNDNISGVKNTSNEYKFKRSFYFDVECSAKNNKVTFIFGARKCGKTVCMKQLATELPNAEYYDIKSIGEDAAMILIDKIMNSIKENEKKTFLVDEATYFASPETTIARIANRFTGYKNTNTRVVFTGSQSIALEAWANRAFAGNAQFVYADFLSYPEWLAYKGIDEVSEKTYNQFILGIREFYSDFVSLDQYLKGCLEETRISNLRSRNIILNNNCDRLNEKILKNMLCAALIVQKDYKTIGNEEVHQRVDKIFSRKLEAYSSMDMESLKQGLIFLYKSGLITLTLVTDEKKNFEKIFDVYTDLCCNDNNRIKTKKDLFENVNISIKYPMFYVDILKEILIDDMSNEIKVDILGGIVESHTRGILPQDCSCEYHCNGREVDYVNFADREAIEISVKNKCGKDLCFDDLPEIFTKTLLTKDQDFTEANGVVRIPYYKFIFEHSVGKELLPKVEV